MTSYTVKKDNDRPFFTRGPITSVHIADLYITVFENHVAYDNLLY